VLGLFCLGIFVPFANAKGAIVGTLTSLAFMMWLFVGFNVYEIKYPKKSFFQYGCPNETTNATLPFELFANYEPYEIKSVIPERYITKKIVHT
jgi:hypothetical protein